MMTISKEIQLISFLLNQGSWVTTSVISDYLELSPRSVSTYISELNKKYDGLILSSNKGYRILKDKACAILNAISTRRIPSNYEERKKYILEKILLSQQFPTIDFLSDRLCVSPSTLQNEISKLRSELSDFHLHLRIKNNKLSIIGLDRDKRRLVLDLINEELENSSFSLESIQDLFVTTDLKRIKKIVTNALKNNEYFLDEYSLLNYILHIAVFIELKGNNYIANAKDHNALRINFRKVTSPHVCKIIEEIFSEIKLAYGGDFTIEDFSEVSLSMMTSAVSNNLGKLHMDQLEELVGREIEKLLFEIVRSVRSTYSIDLKEDGFMIRFAFHLKNVIKRVENNIKLRNSEFKSIKSDFPLIYVIAVFISNIINKKTNHILSEDEIAYIALHIGVLMEEKKAYSEKLKCIVLAPDYYTVGRSLYRRLNEKFSDSILITNFITSYDDLASTEEYDLLLSTIEINPRTEKPHILMDPFLSNTTISNVFQKIEEVKQAKRKQKMTNQFKYFFRNDLFFYDYPFKTYQDAIETMCDSMMEKDYVDKNYKKEIYEHEEVAPSAYGNIAIPHPLSNRAISSVIAISINPTPIQWGTNKVHIVFMLSLQEENRDLFTDIFNSITHLISNKDFFTKIMNAKTYEDFIEILVSSTVN